MTDKQAREAFEAWYKDPDNPRGLRRSDTNPDGYHLMQAQLSWTAWKAAWQAALSSRQNQEGWQPIESAPKDRTRILGLGRVGQIEIVQIVWHFSEYGWCDDDGEKTGIIITHWMHLPTPPKENDA